MLSRDRGNWLFQILDFGFSKSKTDFRFQNLKSASDLNFKISLFQILDFEFSKSKTDFRFQNLGGMGGGNWLFQILDFGLSKSKTYFRFQNIKSTNL